MADEYSTTLDSHLDAPSITAPGDGPADTLDPTERASSASPDKGAAAAKGFGTVNAVVKLPDRKRREPANKEKDRTESYEVEGPDGEMVSVTRNIDTGEVTRAGSGSSARASGQSKADTAKASSEAADKASGSAKS